MEISGKFRILQRRILTFLYDNFLRFRATEHTFMIIAAVIIGLLGGLGAVGIQYLIRLVQKIFWGDWTLSLEYLKALPFYVKILAPTIGSVFVGLIVYFVSMEAKGHGVPEVMEAIALKNGVIRPRVVFAKLFASSLCIGSGGSTGREGPVIQIGSAIGSTLGQFLRVNPQRIKVFVACGAAAGIAAAFNAPVAGALFSLEIILGDFGVAQFSPIVISSVMSTVVARYFLGDHPAFVIPKYHLVSPIELIPYAILGLISGLIALLFIKTLYMLEDFFDNMKLNGVLKTVIGGLGVGIIGVWVPHIYGVGYTTMDLALMGQMPLIFMFALIFLKTVATSISLGSGGSGGIFAPSLFMGTMAGGFFGGLVHLIIPQYSASSGAYSLVGMGAVVGGATHAPLTAIIIIFELTNDYKIILPLMIATIISTVLTMKMKKGSIYTLKLLRRGIDLFRGREINLLRALKVSDVVKKNPVVIPPEINFKELLELMVNSPQGHLYVVDKHEKYLGAISIQEVRQALLDQEFLADLLIAMDIINTDVPMVKMNDDLDFVMKTFSTTTVEELPVIAPSNSRKLVGMVSHKDVIDAYNRELVKRNITQEISSSVKLLEKVQSVNFIEGYVMTEIVAPFSFTGKSIKDLNLRAKYGIHILMIKRQEQNKEYDQLVPTANEVLKKDDILVVMGKKKEIELVKHML